ncbi:MAG: type II toxin-antitoxin system YafQ family toxin [Cyanobacteria bacterium HKST-UBA01]|nr:type II toxin-antitoxin system YafQ family toxin [Cyanobacteria bacterium HKST-UBA01]
MRKLFRTNRFKKDQKRETKGVHKKTLSVDLQTLVDLLLADTVLPVHYRDHAMTGDYKDCRDVHLKPDLVLIYRKVGETELQLIRLGSHSELSI